MAPEIVNMLNNDPEKVPREYDESIDTFSIGVILYILATANMPFPGKTKS